jgi:hypothetical protein
VLAALGSIGEALMALDDNEAFVRNHGYSETLCFHDGFRSLVLRATGAALDDMGFAYEAQAIAESVGGQHLKQLPRPR